MKVAFFSAKKYEQAAFEAANLKAQLDITWIEARLTEQTVTLAYGFDAVCAFVEDELQEATLTHLKRQGIKFIALRSAGYNHINLEVAKKLKLHVARVPEYSPHAVAEHAVALLQTLNRKIHRAYLRVRELNFSLDGLVGHDIFQKTVGVIGTGKIGSAFSRIMLGYGAKVIAYDKNPSAELKNQGVQFVSRDELIQQSDVISLHIPLTQETKHFIGAREFSLMKKGVYFINTSRGGLVDTKALINVLKSGLFGGAVLDVYEEEEGVFFHDLSGQILQDDVLARLLTFPNVLITSHQAFLTHEALKNIAEITIDNLLTFIAGKKNSNFLT